jgi:hypothetical protein
MISRIQWKKELSPIRISIFHTWQASLYCLHVHLSVGKWNEPKSNQVCERQCVRPGHTSTLRPTSGTENRHLTLFASNKFWFREMNFHILHTCIHSLLHMHTSNSKGKGNILCKTKIGGERAHCWAARVQTCCRRHHLGEVVAGRRPTVVPGGLSAVVAQADNHHLFVLAFVPQLLWCGELILPAARPSLTNSHQSGSRDLRDTPARF